MGFYNYDSPLLMPNATQKKYQLLEFARSNLFVHEQNLNRKFSTVQHVKKVNLKEWYPLDV